MPNQKKSGEPAQNQGRPPQSSKRLEGSRQAILDAAAAELQAAGPVRFSVRGVARRAGVGTATVFHHFADRDDLMGSVIERWYVRLERLSQDLRDQVRSRPLDAAFWRVVIAGALEFAFANQAAIAAQTVSAVTSGGLLAGWREKERLFLHSVADALVSRTGCPPAQALLGLRSIIILTGRYALSTQQELQMLCGTDEPARQREVLQNHLTHLALSVFTNESPLGHKPSSAGQ